MGRVDFGGVRKEACLAYLPDVELGDYVIVHVGFAISRVDEEEALRTLEMLDADGRPDDRRSWRRWARAWTRRPSSTTRRRRATVDRPRRPRPRGLPHEVPRRVPRPGARPEAHGRDPPDHDAAVDAHGGLRRPDPHDRQAGHRRGAARGRADDPRARLPGLRDARSSRSTRRSPSPPGRTSSSPATATCCGCPARPPTCWRSRPAAPTCASSTRPLDALKIARGATPTSRSSSSRSASRPPRPPTRWPSAEAARRGHRQLQRPGLATCSCRRP